MAGPPVVRVTMTRPEYPADPYVRRPPARAGRVAGAPEPSIAGAPEEPPNRPGRPGLTAWRWVIAAGGVAVAAVVVVAVLAFRLGAASGAGPGSGTAAAGPGGATGTSPTVASTLPVTAVYSQVAQSVVLITTSKGAVGSGVVVTDTGTVLTANHVVSGGGTVAITFADGTRSAASVASTDKTTDMALLTPAALPSVVVPATLGGGLAVGSDVVAIGNPLGLVDSTTSGVVSGLNRTATTDAGTFSGLIQFDAAVNPGSSGGPLLDDRGLVVGIVVSIADPGDDDSFAGIGFAVPIATAVGGGGSGPGRGGGPQI
jgi:S1-C subfamily serine protease